MIGLCIKYYYENYGGMLQAYATIKLFEKYGLEYELIRYQKKKDVKFYIKALPRIFNNVLLNDKYEAIRKRISSKRYPEFGKKCKLKLKAFAEFRDEKFSNKLSEVYYGFENLKKGAEKYDIVVTGSDQLWSPAGLPTNFYNLMFVPDNIKKVSYASSFGVKSIPWYQKKRTADYLKRIDCISMRENAGKAIVKELTGRDVPVVLDPVFMLEKKEWEEIIKPERVYEEKYIFAYFLGRNPEYRKKVIEFARKKNLKIVALRNNYVDEENNFGDYAPYDLRPDTFLNILRNAEYVFTDSFHGTVFSIIHEKKFIVFNRYDEASKHSKNSRIDSLCENFELSDRRYCGDIENIADKEIDYARVKETYNKLKNESEKYLKEALSL